MKKISKLMFPALILGIGFAGYKVYDNSRGLDLDTHFELKQTPLELSSLDIGSNNPLWSVKSDSKLVCFCITFRNEGERSFATTPGLIDLTLNNLMEGAGEHDGIELKKLLSNNSINISFTSTKDDILVTCSCLEKNFGVLVNTLSDLFNKAHFNPEKLEMIKQNMIVAIKQSQFSPESMAEERINNLMFPENHPYRYSSSGTLKALEGYSKDDVLNCYKQIFSKKNAEITIVSGLDNARIQKEFSKLLNSLNQKKNEFSKIENSQAFDIKPLEDHVELDNPQSTVLFAFPGVSGDSADYYAANLACDIFGQFGLISRLSKVVRDENGLVYRIRVAPRFSLDLCSYVMGSASTRPENVEKVISSVKSEYKRLFDKGITQEELEMFRTKRFAENIFDSSASILSFVMQIRSQGITDIESVNTHLDNYKKLTAEDVNRAIRNVFDPEKIMFVDCGKGCEKNLDKKCEEGVSNENSK